MHLLFINNKKYCFIYMTPKGPYLVHNLMWINCRFAILNLYKVIASLRLLWTFVMNMFFCTYKKKLMKNLDSKKFCICSNHSDTVTCFVAFPASFSRLGYRLSPLSLSPGVNRSIVRRMFIYFFAVVSLLPVLRFFFMFPFSDKCHLFLTFLDFNMDLDKSTELRWENYSFTCL